MNLSRLDQRRRQLRHNFLQVLLHHPSFAHRPAVLPLPQSLAPASLLDPEENRVLVLVLLLLLQKVPQRHPPGALM